jgi:hypothetical protein
MSDDHFIDKVHKSWERHTGEEWSPERARENFALYGKAKRIQALEQLDEALKQEPATAGNLRRYTQLTALQRDFEQIHQMQTKVDR